MPRRIKGDPMKHWGFYISPAGKEATIECAKAANESDSEYIRKAVEQRNIQQQIRQYKQDQTNNGESEIKTILNDTYHCTVCGELRTRIGDHICNADIRIKPIAQKEKVKEMENPKMVQSFTKGGK